MMKLAHITPIENLEISKLGDIDFCLAPYLSNEKYKNYFEEQLKNNRLVILDNLIAENNPIPTQQMVELALMLKPTEFIIPDVIGDKIKTDSMREEFLEKYYSIFHDNGIKLLSVIQGNTFLEYMDSFVQLNNDSRIDVIGIPFRMRFSEAPVILIHKDLYQATNRIKFLRNIKDIVNKPIHCLGCNSTVELRVLNSMSHIRSCDSKIVCRYALMSKEIEFEIMKPINKVELNESMDLMHEIYGINNANKLKEMLNGK